MDARKITAAILAGAGVLFMLNIDTRALTAATVPAFPAKGGKVPGGTTSKPVPGTPGNLAKAPGGTATSGDADLIARTIFGEAGGEGRRGMELVAAVILNRLSAQAWYGSTISEVILKPYQFTLWNAGNIAGLNAAAVNDNDPTFQTALAIARQAVNGQLQERAQGATHYFNPAAANPSWQNAANMQFLFAHGKHRFYREALTA